jgi:hypothetical protein
VPRPVSRLRLQQELDAALIRRVDDADATAITQRHEHLRRGIGVALSASHRAPAAIGSLRRPQLPRQLPQRRAVGPGPAQPEQLIAPFFGVARRPHLQESARTRDGCIRLGLLTGVVIRLHRPQPQRRHRHPAVGRRWTLVKAVPVARRVLSRDEQAGVDRRAQIRLHAGRARRHHPVRIVHGRLDDVGVLHGAVDVGEGERLQRIGACDLFVERHPVVARRSIGQRGLILVMARRAHLLIGGVPEDLSLLNRPDRADGGVTRSCRIDLLRE